MAEHQQDLLTDLRALAEAATPGPWHVESHVDMLDPPATWHIARLERWRGYTNPVQFGEDEATARYVAAVSPDVVLGLLDEIERLRTSTDELPGLLNDLDDERANYGGAMADLYALVEVAEGAITDAGVSRLMRFLAANYPKEARRG